MSVPAPFQVIIMAGGKGSRMTEITTGKPKCLLPVGPKPLIWYPLKTLVSCGFTDCIIVVLENQKQEIQWSIDNRKIGINIEYFSIPTAHGDIGTADTLRLLHHKLESDVLILPCDLITNANLEEAINMFRKNSASVTSLFVRSHELGSTIVPGPHCKNTAPERDLVGIDAVTNRLVYLASFSDFDDGDVDISIALLDKHPHIKMFSNLVDCHTYIMRKWVVDYLKNSKTKISTLKEFLPHIVEKQLLKVPEKVDLDGSMLDFEPTDEIFDFAGDSEVDTMAITSSTSNDHTGDSKPLYHGDCIRCFAYIAPADNFAIRVNTLPLYCSINDKIIEKWSQIVPNKTIVLKSSKADIKSTQVDNECIIWKGAKLSEKTSFTKSNIGLGVEVNSLSRVVNCILMKNVIIRERVVLENCIISDNAIIGAGTQLKSCLVGSHYNVPDDSEHCNEVLTHSIHLMEVVV